FSSGCGSQVAVVLKWLWFSSGCGLISVQVEFNGSVASWMTGIACSSGSSLNGSTGPHFVVDVKDRLSKTMVEEPNRTLIQGDMVLRKRNVCK
ncbi:MAG: hypothetical protein OSB12_00780, partial [Planctomycetota bacterium]|nr:hypothetical protein [Planctomycetota bacterium]